MYYEPTYYEEPIQGNPQGNPPQEQDGDKVQSIHDQMMALNEEEKERMIQQFGSGSASNFSPA